MSTFKEYFQRAEKYVTVNGQDGERPLRVRRLMDEFVSPEMTMRMSPNRIYSLIESHPLHPVFRRRLTRFNEKERKVRRRLSEEMREIMANYIFAQIDNGRQYHLGRSYTALLMYNAVDGRDEHNAEVIRLFAQRSEEDERLYINQLAEQRIAEAKENRDNIDEVSTQIRAELAKQRGAFICNYVTRCVEYLDEFSDRLTRLDAGEDMLRYNFNRVMELYGTMYEIDRFLSAANADWDGAVPYISLSTEQKNTLLSIKDKYQPIVAALISKLGGVANPCYEFIDLGELVHYDLREIEADYRDEIKTNAFDNDNFTRLIKDGIAVNYARDLRIDDGLDDLLHRFGFGDDAVITAENADFEEQQPLNSDLAREQLKNGHPVVVSAGGRTVIVSRTGGPADSGLTVSTPDELFNHYLGSKKIDIIKRLIEVDPFYVRSSPEFREFRSVLEQVAVLPYLPADSVEDAARYRDILTALRQKADTYLKKKHWGEDIARSDIEEDRVTFAADVLAFAEQKLGQLDTIGKARETMRNYEANAAQEDPQAEQEPQPVDNARENNIPPIIEAVEDEVPGFIDDDEGGGAMREEDEQPEEHKNDDAPEVKGGMRENEDMPEQPQENPDVPRRKAWVEEADRLRGAAHEEDPSGRLQSMADGYAETLPALADELCDTCYDVLMSIIPRENGIDVHGIASDALVNFAGMMIASQLIGEEKKSLAQQGVQGVYETLLCGQDGSDIRQELGRQYLLSVYGTDSLGEDDDAAKIDFLSTFDPQKAADGMREAFDKAYSIDFAEMLAENFRDTIKPMRGEQLDASEEAFIGWTCENILKPGCEYCACGLANTANKILACCVLHNMVQLERASLAEKGPGDLEKMLSDPKSAKRLQKRVLEDGTFRQMADNIGLNGDEVKFDVLPQAIGQHLPHKAADTIFKTAFVEEVKKSLKPAAPQVEKQPEKAVK